MWRIKVCLFLLQPIQLLAAIGLNEVSQTAILYYKILPRYYKIYPVFVLLSKMEHSQRFNGKRNSICPSHLIGTKHDTLFKACIDK